MAQSPLASDLILVLLRGKAEQPDLQDQLAGITRLEKLLFLADQETDIRNSVKAPFTFQAYNFGPYSKEVYESVELLEELGLIREERHFEGGSIDELEEIDTALDEKEGVERRFYLTDPGRAVADLLIQRHPGIAGAMSEIKNRYGALPLRRLIRDVYTRYPDMASESLIRREFS